MYLKSITICYIFWCLPWFWILTTYPWLLNISIFSLLYVLYLLILVHTSWTSIILMSVLGFYQYFRFLRSFFFSAFNTWEWKHAFTVNFCILIFTFAVREVLRIFVLILDVLMTFISSRNSFHPPAYKIWERGYVSLIFVIYLVITV